MRIMGGHSVTRSMSRSKPTMSKALKRLIRDLKRNKYVAVGSPKPEHELNARLSPFSPQELTMFYKPLVNAIFGSPRVAVVLLLGSRFKAHKHDEILAHICNRMTTSNVVCLNLGEFDSDPTPLIRALPKSLVGNLWYSETTSSSRQRTKMRKAARKNRAKWGYKSQIARDDVWDVLRHGCKALWNPSKVARQFAMDYASDASHRDEVRRNRGRAVKRNYLKHCKTPCRRRCIGAVTFRGESVRCCKCALPRQRLCKDHLIRGGGKRKRHEFEPYDPRVAYPKTEAAARKKNSRRLAGRPLTVDLAMPSDHARHTERMKRALRIEAALRRMRRGRRGVKRKASAL